MAMVHGQNKKDAGIGGHISTYSSLATLLEVGFNPLLPCEVWGPAGRLYLLSGSCFAGRVCAGLFGRAF